MALAMNNAIAPMKYLWTKEGKSTEQMDGYIKGLYKTQGIDLEQAQAPEKTGVTKEGGGASAAKKEGSKAEEPKPVMPNPQGIRIEPAPKPIGVAPWASKMPIKSLEGRVPEGEQQVIEPWNTKTIDVQGKGKF
jgi:hypothetical protein